MFKKIKKYINNKKQWANDNNPESFWGLFNENYLSKKTLYQNLKLFLPKLKGNILDVGCWTKPYKSLATNCTSYIGLEYDTKEETLNDFNNKKIADYYYDGETFPFEDESFDNVFSSQVLEHVPNPERIIYEMSRVLKKDGLILLSIPFVFPEHMQPYDFYRYTTFGIKNLLEKNNFKILELHKTLSDRENILNLSNILFRKNLFNIFLHNVYGNYFLHRKNKKTQIRENSTFFNTTVVLAQKIK